MRIFEIVCSDETQVLATHPRANPIKNFIPFFTIVYTSKLKSNLM